MSSASERRAARRAAAEARRAARLERQKQRQGFLSGVVGEEGLTGIVGQGLVDNIIGGSSSPSDAPYKDLDGASAGGQKMDFNKLLPILAVAAAFMFLKKK